MRQRFWFWMMDVTLALYLWTVRRAGACSTYVAWIDESLTDEEAEAVRRAMDERGTPW